jgi:hypothetical protein
VFPVGVGAGIVGRRHRSRSGRAIQRTATVDRILLCMGLFFTKMKMPPSCSRAFNGGSGGETGVVTRQSLREPGFHLRALTAASAHNHP